MKRLLFILLLATPAVADTNITAPRNAAATIQFELRDAEGATPGLDLEASATCASGDVTLVKDGAASTNTTNCFADEGGGRYSLALVAGELDGKVTSLRIVDQTGTKVWVDKVINIYTYGDSSAFHSVPGVNVTQWNGTAVATPHTAGYPIVTVKDGTGTGEIDTASGAVASVTTAATCTNLTNLPTIPTNWITAAGIASGAIGADEIAANAITSAKIATDAIGAAQIAAGAIVKGTEITGFNDLSAAQVNAEVDTALADYDPPTKAELDAGFAALNNLSAAQVNAEMVDVLSTDTYAELAACPTFPMSIRTMLQVQAQWTMFKKDKDSVAELEQLYKDDGSTVLCERPYSDTGTVRTLGEYVVP